MGKYLKKFGEHTGYETFVQSDSFVMPNVSHCVTNEHVHYNPIIDWIDPEFKRICLENFNGGREMSYYDLASVTQERWDQVVNANGSSIFSNNSEIHSIADTEKFINVHTLGKSTFEGLTGVVGDLVIPSNIQYIKNQYVFRNMTGVTNIIINHEISWTGNSGYDGPKAFAQLRKVSGIVDLRNFKKIGDYHEFDGLGAAGSGCQVLMPALNQAFGVWFASSKVSALAGSEEELVNGTIKIPEGYTHGGQLAFNDCALVRRVICPESMTTFDNFCGGDGSWNVVKYFELGSNTTSLKGAVCGENGHQGNTTVVVCKAVEPPLLSQGGVGISGTDNQYNYPFMNTTITAIYVPKNSIGTYESDTRTAINDGSEIGWSRFAGKIKSIEEDLPQDIANHLVP